MRMPRFGTRSLLIAFVLVGIWLSTFSNYMGARDVRAATLLVAFLSAGLVAVFYRGRCQAFCIGFFVAMLVMSAGYPKPFVPNSGWVVDWWQQHYMVNPTDHFQPAYNRIHEIVQTATMLALSCVVG